jgi:hypothetical protein
MPISARDAQAQQQRIAFFAPRLRARLVSAQEGR